MGRFARNKMGKVLAALFVVLLCGGIAQAVYIDAFNKTPHTASGADESQPTYLKFSDRDDTTSKWVKRDYDLNGETVDIWAQTVDGTLVNNSDDVVDSWTMTINIEKDCFINNAWVGTVEIHQFVGTDKEAVQTLDLRDYKIENVELTYLYDGDLLIPLQKGDYIVYLPSEKDEFNIAPHGELTMGVIFYYLDDLDLSSHSIEYYYHRDFTYGLGFIALVVLAAVLLLLFAGAVGAEASYRRATREMELKKSGLASMSSIYSIISIIDLAKDEIIPVYADEQTKEAPLEGAGAQWKLLDIFGRDTAEPYRAGVLEFVNISTLGERLERESIACEYVSKTYGWSQVRFFAVDREEGQPLERVLLTIQDINDEKRELERFEQRSAQVELESSTRNAFVAGLSDTMRIPVQAIDDLSEKIVTESGEESIRLQAKQIRRSSKLLGYLINNAIELTTTDLDGVQPEIVEYSIREMISEAYGIAFTMSDDRELVFEQEISPSIPERLVGDERRVKQALTGILASAARRQGTETVKLSVFGTSREGYEHLLFSVKAGGSVLGEEEARLLAGFIAGLEEGEHHGVDRPVQELEGVAILLLLIGSKLQVVNAPGEGCELYFEIEQQVIGESSSDGK